MVIPLTVPQMSIQPLDDQPPPVLGGPRAGRSLCSQMIIPRDVLHIFVFMFHCAAFTIPAVENNREAPTLVLDRN